MRVERFSLFFGPMLWKVRRGETEYGIGPIPLGGYVKITGMNPHEQSAEAVRLDKARERLQQRLVDLEASHTHDPRRAQNWRVRKQSSGQRLVSSSARWTTSTTPPTTTSRCGSGSS